MDKVINFKDDEEYNNDDYYEGDEGNEGDEGDEGDENELVSEDEITAEERAYYNSITSKISNNLNIISNDEINKRKQEKINLKKEKKLKKMQKFKDKFEAVEKLYNKKKKWKSSRAEKHKRENGVIKVERRKFNPRPLPLDWNSINNLDKNIISIPSLESFPSLGNKIESIKPNNNLLGIWNKKK